MEIRLAHHRPSDATVVSLSGHLDLDTAGSLGQALDELYGRRVTRVVLDLAGLAFCDSIGLSTLVVAHHRCAALGGYFRLAAPSPFLLRMLTIVGVRDTLDIYRSAAAACRGDPAEVVADAPRPDWDR